MRKKITFVLVMLVLSVVGYFVWKFVDAVRNGERLGAQAVAHFHAQFNAGADEAIYQESSPRFREATKLADFVQYNTLLRAKLGANQGVTQTGFNVNFDNGNTFLVLKYHATFQKGLAVESFVFDLNGREPRLLHFDVYAPGMAGLPAR
jgi:hypothetical protein